MKTLRFMMLLAVIVLSGCQTKEDRNSALSDSPEVPTVAVDQQSTQDTEQHDNALDPSKLIPVQNAGGDVVAGTRTTRSTAQKDHIRRTQDEQNTIDIFSDSAPATVFVIQNQLKRDFWSARATEVPAGSGSGFIWDNKGHIVTNYHVVQGGSSFSVTLYNQKKYSAEIVGVEPKKDIAVLKINAPAQELTPIQVPRDDYQLQVGQKTIAIGNPFGLDHTLTTGIISAIGREMAGIGGVTIRDMIQTDAAINMGNSGGPLLDSEGQLIGMNTMIYSPSGSSAGIGFAVPYTAIKRVVPQIIRTGKAEQVGLGISIVSDDIAKRNKIKGVIIMSVSPGSPAEKAGLLGISETNSGIFINDIIVGIDEHPVTNYDSLYNALDAHKPGDVVQVKILRKGEPKTVPVKLTVLK